MGGRDREGKEAEKGREGDMKRAYPLSIVENTQPETEALDGRIGECVDGVWYSDATYR